MSTVEDLAEQVATLFRARAVVEAEYVPLIKNTQDAEKVWQDLRREAARRPSQVTGATMVAIVSAENAYLACKVISDAKHVLLSNAYNDYDAANKLLVEAMESA